MYIYIYRGIPHGYMWKPQIPHGFPLGFLHDFPIFVWVFQRVAGKWKLIPPNCWELDPSSQRYKCV